jgi:hypothetical protein
MDNASSMGGAHTPTGMFVTGFGTSSGGQKHSSGQVFSARSRMTAKGPYMNNMFFDLPFNEK